MRCALTLPIAATLLFYTFFPSVVCGVAPPSDLDPHVSASIGASEAAIAPGEPFRLAVRLDLDDEWHLYWLNAGDSGIPPDVRLGLPDGFRQEPFQWPHPERMDVAPLTSYAYSRELVLPCRVTPPGDLPLGSTVEITATVNWLVCKESCIPGDTTLVLSLPVRAAPEPDVAWAALIDGARARVPVTQELWQIEPTVAEGSLTLTLKPRSSRALPEIARVRFFPLAGDLIDHAASQVFTREADRYELHIPRAAFPLDSAKAIEGVLVSETGWPGVRAETGSEEARAISFAEHVRATDRAAPQIAAPGGLSAGRIARILALAFVGGLVLNLMPCVLPVLSIKVLGFVAEARGSRRHAAAQAWVFAAGVLASFWALVAVLELLRAGGQAVGWGFQLQSPAFVLVLASFFFLFGLNLLGVYEVEGFLGALESRATERRHLTGAFVSGVTTTAAATPCTAPFMGTALAAVLTLPPWVGWLTFTALALGVAAPYVVLSTTPSLARLVPRPGPWMETLKQVLGFLLLGTVVWLAWVLNAQAGGVGVVALLGVLLLLGFCAWGVARFASPWAGPRARRIVRPLAFLAMAAFVAAGARQIGTFSPNGATSATGLGNRTESLSWEPFSPARVDELRRGRKPVFVDFTARWCLSCQVNDRLALSSGEVQRRFSELGVTLLKADWTSRDPMITEALASYGRNSVPVYVLYGSDPAEGPIFLPEILTPGIVLDALAKLGEPEFAAQSTKG